MLEDSDTENDGASLVDMASKSAVQQASENVVKQLLFLGPQTPISKKRGKGGNTGRKKRPGVTNNISAGRTPTKPTNEKQAKSGDKRKLTPLPQ